MKPKIKNEKCQSFPVQCLHVRGLYKGLSRNHSLQSKWHELIIHYTCTCNVLKCWHFKTTQPTLSTCATRSSGGNLPLQCIEIIQVSDDTFRGALKSNFWKKLGFCPNQVAPPPPLSPKVGTPKTMIFNVIFGWDWGTPAILQQNPNKSKIG